MKLEIPTLEHDQAFKNFLEDFKTHDQNAFLRYLKDDIAIDDFRKFVEQCEDDRHDWRPKAGQVATSRYVLRIEPNKIATYSVMRFPLDDSSELDGGNIQVFVAPEMRGKNYGSYALSLMLFEAVRAGLRRVLATAPESELAARRVIEKNRGILHDLVTSPLTGEKIARYWISFYR